jgi:archaellum biogenesis ATPase FlaH
MDESTSRAAKAQFGVSGLDDILNGGLVRNRLYLMEGPPGSGKTTLGLQFLIEGANAHEKGLYITLSETEQELRETAVSHYWSIPQNIDIFELLPPESLLDEKQQQSLLYSSDLELGETTHRIFEAMDRSKPSRLVLERLGIASVLSAVFVLLMAARSSADSDYKKICLVTQNLRVLDDSDDANSCRAIAVGSQAQEYQIGCRDSESQGTILVTTPFSINDKAARVTSSKLAANTLNTASPEQFAKCAKTWGSQ